MNPSLKRWLNIEFWEMKKNQKELLKMFASLPPFLCLPRSLSSMNFHITYWTPTEYIQIIFSLKVAQYTF
jgi:hypothetical protein